MRIPSVGGVLLLTLTGCPPADGTTDPSTGGDETTTADATATASTGAGTTTEPDPTTGASTVETTGGPDGTTTGGPDDTTTGPVNPACMCFEPGDGGGEFQILCPAEPKAGISGSCMSGTCMYDEAAIDAALAFLATGEAGIVTWNIDTNSFAAPPPHDELRALHTSADCSFQFCTGGIHVVTGDGMIFTQTLEYMDLTGSITGLVGATLKDADYFNTCATDPDAAARFACVKAAGQPPDFGECVPGDDLDYF